MLLKNGDSFTIDNSLAIVSVMFIVQILGFKIGLQCYVNILFNLQQEQTFLF